MSGFTFFFDFHLNLNLGLILSSAGRSSPACERRFGVHPWHKDVRRLLEAVIWVRGRQGVFRLTFRVNRL